MTDHLSGGAWAPALKQTNAILRRLRPAIDDGATNRVNRSFR